MENRPPLRLSDETVPEAPKEDHVRDAANQIAMNRLLEELREKFKSPDEAVSALFRAGSMRYSIDASRTLSPTYRQIGPQQIQILHAAVGIASESGEIMDILKKIMFTNKDMGEVGEHLAEELGDLLWYISLMCMSLHISIAEVMDRNISKLRARFPEKFEDAKNESRDIKEEYAAMGVEKVPETVDGVPADARRDRQPSPEDIEKEKKDRIDYAHGEDD